MSVVALVIAPSIAISADAMMAYNEDKIATEVVEKQMEQQIRVEMSNTEDGAFKAVVTSSATVNGEMTETVKEFTGATKEEVKAQVEAYNSSITIE